MGDVKIHPSQQRKSMGRHTSVSDVEELKIAPGTSGSISSMNPRNGVVDEDDERSSSRTRRGRSSNFKALDLLSAKLHSSDSDAKTGSPSGPAAYLNSVRNNLTFDIASSPMHDKSSGISSGPSNNGNTSGYKLPQKRRNRGQDGAHHKPAEIFRKDLISAMKIPDTSQLATEEYWLMRDTWRMEWEKGVQVPVNPGGLPAAKVESIPKETKGCFRMPRKFIKTMPDAGDKDAVNLNILADTTCRYDLDEVDVAWLEVINEERSCMGDEPLDESTMEMIMEELENQCHENLQLAIKTKEGLGIEYDENIVCDVCRTPECEEGNEMVFCDGCNLCVHQACYGILKVPDGSWLCKPCALGIRGSAVCILCGKKGGAMKSTKSGRKWAHMSCALWIPEITIADPERMEPITKVSHIPSSRWSLVCTVCKERSTGACIQCSVRHCVTAYHVTCAMESGFDMITDCVSPTSAPNAGESAIIFRSYCQKHSKNSKKKSENSPSKKTEEEKRSDRQKRIAELEEDFFTLVKSKGVANVLNIPIETITQVMEYWKLKRKANFNRPLVTPKQEEGKALEEAAETGLQRRLRMFTHLRQDLERVRNLCYMIGKREKMKRSSVKIMSNVFLAQIHYLEYRMSHSSNFDPTCLISSLPKFGSPDILSRAKRESDELAKTKEWSSGIFHASETQPPDPVDDPLDDDLSIQLPHPRSNVSIVANTPSIKLADNKGYSRKSEPKNGLVIGKVLKKNRHTAKDDDKTMNTDSTAMEKDFTSKANLKAEEKKVRNRKRSLESRHTDSMSSAGESSDFSSIRNGNRSHRRSTDNFRNERGQSKSKNTDPLSSSESNRDTVNETESKRKSYTRRGRLKSESKEVSKTSDGHKPLLQRDSRMSRQDKNAPEDSEKPDQNQESGVSSPQKKLRKHSREQRHSKQKSPVPDTKQPQEKLRRSSRHLEFSNSEESDSSARRINQRPKMTISTETISETKRYEVKSGSSESRKRNWSKSSEKTHFDEKAAKKRPKLESSRTLEERAPRRKSLRKQGESSAEDSDFTSLRSSRKSSQPESMVDDSVPKTAKLKKTEEKLPSRDSSPTSHGRKTFEKRQAAKNGQRALAPSRGQSRSAACDKTGDIETEIKPARRSSGQELIDPNERDSSPKDVSPPLSKRPSSPRSSTSSPQTRSPILDLDEPNPAFAAAGLDIGYGSNAPSLLRQTSRKKSSSRPKPSGLKWVALGDDFADNGVVDSGRAATPKDQEGYRGDMDESDSESQNLLQKHHHRRLSSRKRSSLNPGKYRTGIGVFSTKSSDSSEDDFDLSFTSGIQDSAEKAQRQKLRSISNNSPGPTDKIHFPSTSSFNETRSIRSQEKTANPVDVLDKQTTGPKNVKAVGGIQGALKSERDLETTPFLAHTTGGQDFQDNVFDKFSHFKDDKSLSAPFVDPMQASLAAFGQSQLISPRILDFHGNAPPFQSRPLFPYGAINPWQITQPTSLPSIIPNQCPLPVYYQYPPVGPNNIFKSEMQPSPPPMPDSTLSPESFVPASASVAVQASSDQSITPHDIDKTEKQEKFKGALHRPTYPVDDNEWEIVPEEDVQHGHNEEESNRHRRKHKKKKKKKKRRRMLFPDGFDIEKRDTSSPATSHTEPIHGAIVPPGHSTQYDIDANSTSEIASSSARTNSDAERKTPNSQKLVLKINKRDLFKEEEKHKETVPPFNMLREDSLMSRSIPQSKSCVSGLKLTFKKSQHEHLVKKGKHRRKFHSPKHSFSSYTVSPTPGTEYLPLKPKVNRNTAALRRLGLDLNQLPDTEPGDDGIGRRALRERKPSGKQESATEDPTKKMEKSRPGISAGKNVSNTSPKLRRDLRIVGDTSSSQPTMSAATDAVKRGRGRPRKNRPLSSSSATVEVEPSSDTKLGDQSKMGDNKDLAKFAGWSTKSSKASSSLPGLKDPQPLLLKSFSSGRFRSKPGGVSIRSFSTDSDQTSTTSMSGQHPARHWKKRKVQEHETQLSGHPGLIHSPDPSFSVISEKSAQLASETPSAVSEKESLVERRRGISQPVKLHLNNEGRSQCLQGHSEKPLTVASLPQAVRCSTEYNPKTMTLSLDLGQMSPWSSVTKNDKRSLPSPSKQKSPSEFTASTSRTALNSKELAIISQVDEDKSSSALASGLPKAPPKPKTPTTTPTKSGPPDFSLGSAMQTGLLNNFKIPKKLQVNAESRLPTDTLD